MEDIPYGLTSSLLIGILSHFAVTSAVLIWVASLYLLLPLLTKPEKKQQVRSRKVADLFVLTPTLPAVYS